MGIDITKFYQSYFEESLEGLEAMEDGLLELEEGSEDNEAINTIFRAAHSIKGGAGTLGFSAMAEFTHLVETILDRRRSGRGRVTQDTIDVLLASVDCLREMLASAQDGADLDPQRIAAVEARLQVLVNADEGAAATGTADPAGEAGDVGDEQVAVAAAEVAPEAPVDTGSENGDRWRISFVPEPYLFRTGNDPVRILDELASLGHYEVEADVSALPDLEYLDVDVCYCSWIVELSRDDDGSPIDRTTITEIFEWVEDDAVITITSLDDGAAPSEPVADDGPPAGSGLPGPGLDAARSTSGPPVSDGIVPVADPAVADAGSSHSTATLAGAEPSHAGSDDRPEGERVERRSGNDRRADRSGATTTSIRVDIEKVDTLINMVGELVITQSMLQQLAIQGDELDLERFREGLAELESNTRELQASVMQIRMLPISFSFSRLPRLVRDLASKLGKKVDLQIHGENTELDKTVMEKIGDPLVHLVRNALDHGLETPEERVAAGKPETGTVVLSAYHEGGNIVIEIVDDGAGLNTARIAAKARERGLMGDDDHLSEKQINDFIFHPGFSTADAVSDISGRGVGMDVVKRNITDLSGVIEVESVKGRGTTFRIRLPLTLAILDGQVVRVGEQLYIVPLVSIVESLQLDPALIGQLAKGADVYRHRCEAIPLISVNEAFRLGGEHRPGKEPLLVVVEADGHRAGLIVDDLLAQQQIVIKSLTTNFRAVPGLSGATILGDGTVAMIIDVNSVVALYQQLAPMVDRVA